MSTRRFTEGHTDGRSPSRMTVLLCLSLLPALAAAADGGTWLCTADAATAYRYHAERERWQTLVFPAGEHHYIVRPSATPERTWEVVLEGRSDAAFACHGDFDAQGTLVCGPDDDFRMNRRDLAFSVHRLNEAVVPADALAVSATGRCTAEPDTAS